MTWYLDPETGDVYDHNGDVVGTVDGSDGYTIPADVYEIMIEAKEGDQPSAYNQNLLMDAATENIELGTPS